MVADGQSVNRKNDFIFVQRPDTTICARQKIPRSKISRMSAAAFFADIAAPRRETAFGRLPMAPRSLQERFPFERRSLGGGGYR